MDLKGKKVLVFGSGKSGIAAVKLLYHQKADIVLFDGNIELDVSRVKEALGEIAGSIRIKLGNLEKEELETLGLEEITLDENGYLFASLPANTDKPLPVIGFIAHMDTSPDMSGKNVAITGTNGKTTTTSLLGEIMGAAYEDVRVVGNIGVPYTEMVEGSTEDTVTVAEISSFQLETIDTFCPKVSAVLNITPDHLNRHHTMENYIAAKLSITKNQTMEDTCVLNYEDEELRKFGEIAKVSVLYFSSARKLEKGLYLDGRDIMYADGTNVEKVICVDELNILGMHNYENAMAASAMALSYGVDLGVIRTVLRQFQAVEHRIEYVTEKRGVRFYNDSKGTNPDAAIKGIQAMDRPTCLIGGGYDKESEYDEWIDSFNGKVKKLVLIGQTREKIAQTAEKHGFHDYVFAESLQEAVDICYANAESGDAVLLSPACASWGMFPNYEVRGEEFKKYVNAL